MLNLYQELVRTEPDTITQIEDLVAALALANAIKAEFEKHASLVDVPERLEDKIRSLGRELKTRTADVLEKRLREAKARREGLKTSEEKRKDAEAEIQRLTELTNKVGA